MKYKVKKADFWILPPTTLIGDLAVRKSSGHIVVDVKTQEIACAIETTGCVHHGVLIKTDEQEAREAFQKKVKSFIDAMSLALKQDQRRVIDTIQKAQELKFEDFQNEPDIEESQEPDDADGS